MNRGNTCKDQIIAQLQGANAVNRTYLSLKDINEVMLGCCMAQRAVLCSLFERTSIGTYEQKGAS